MTRWMMAAALVTPLACADRASERTAAVVRRYAAAEATQAVAVDSRFFYAIGSRTIGKYDKRTGRRVGRWEEAPGGRVAHLNSGIVLANELHCAHSNYPQTPMVSSIEIFDADSLTPVRSVALPSGLGSATWVLHDDDHWWVTFAHYAGRGGEAGKGPERTQLVRFDRNWQHRGAWTFPSEVVARWDGMSSSGGAWLGERLLVTTGHHAPELYVLAVPADRPRLELREIVAAESEGQGIAFDAAERVLYSIQRRTGEVLVSKF